MENDSKDTQEKVSHETQNGEIYNQLLDLLKNMSENLSGLNESLVQLRKEVRGDEKTDEPEPEKDEEPEPQVEKDEESIPEKSMDKDDEDEIEEIKEGLGL